MANKFNPSGSASDIYEYRGYWIELDTHDIYTSSGKLLTRSHHTWCSSDEEARQLIDIWCEVQDIRIDIMPDLGAVDLKKLAGELEEGRKREEDAERWVNDQGENQLLNDQY